MKTIYLANPYGFSAEQRSQLLPRLVKAVERLGIEVWEPFERNNQIDFSTPGWAYSVGQRDLDDVRRSDGILAVVNGTPPDEGVMVELGVAIALHKAIFLYRDDFRRCTDSEDYPLNLMIFTGLPEDVWRDYLYDSIDALGDPSRPLARWSVSDNGTSNNRSG